MAQIAESRTGTANRSTRSRSKPAPYKCWLKGQDNYKLLLGNLCSKELSLIGHITQAVMGMICYLYQNWEEQDRIRYEISYGKGLIDWSLSFRSFAGQKLVPSAKAELDLFQFQFSFPALPCRAIACRRCCGWSMVCSTLMMPQREWCRNELWNRLSRRESMPPALRRRLARQMEVRGWERESRPQP